MNATPTAPEATTLVPNRHHLVGTRIIANANETVALRANRQAAEARETCIAVLARLNGMLAAIRERVGALVEPEVLADIALPTTPSLAFPREPALEDTRHSRQVMVDMLPYPEGPREVREHMLHLLAFNTDNNAGMLQQTLSLKGMPEDVREIIALLERLEAVPVIQPEAAGDLITQIGTGIASLWRSAWKMGPTAKEAERARAVADLRVLLDDMTNFASRLILRDMPADMIAVEIFWEEIHLRLEEIEREIDALAAYIADPGQTERESLKNRRQRTELGLRRAEERLLQIEEQLTNGNNGSGNGHVRHTQSPVPYQGTGQRVSKHAGRRREAAEEAARQDLLIEQGRVQRRQIELTEELADIAREEEEHDPTALDKPRVSEHAERIVRGRACLTPDIHELSEIARPEYVNRLRAAVNNDVEREGAEQAARLLDFCAFALEEQRQILLADVRVCAEQGGDRQEVNARIVAMAPGRFNKINGALEQRSVALANYLQSLPTGVARVALRVMQERATQDARFGDDAPIVMGEYTFYGMDSGHRRQFPATLLEIALMRIEAQRLEEQAAQTGS